MNEVQPKDKQIVLASERALLKVQSTVDYLEGGSKEVDIDINVDQDKNDSQIEVEAQDKNGRSTANLASNT